MINALSAKTQYQTNPEQMSQGNRKIEILLERDFEQIPSRSFDRITNVCRNVDDEEAIEEASPFLGRKWIEITPDIWREHWSALAFLSDQAFVYFLPSLIKSSFVDFASTINAVDSFLFDLSRVFSEKGDFNRERLQQLSIAQLECVKEWIAWLEKNHLENFSSLVLAKDNIEKLLNLKE